MSTTRKLGLLTIAICLSVLSVSAVDAVTAQAVMPQFDAPPIPRPAVVETPAGEDQSTTQTNVDSPTTEESKSDEPESTLAIGAGLNTDPHLEDVFLGKADPNLDDLRQLQYRVNDLVERLRPAVVGIRMQDGQGSGVIVTSDGYILTAAHVVGQKGLKAQVVMPDGSTHDAIVLGTDAPSDSGMLRLLDKGPWPNVPIGESGSLQEGQWVLALGHPGGFDPDRDSVVRVGRMLTKPGKTTLQTDCTLVGGDSGGPLFDLDGFVIGIHSRISRRIQQNYHVSVDIFTSTWDQMATDPKLSFGFSLKNQTETDKLIVESVAGPCARAGMQVGDELLKINKVEVHSRDDIRKSFEGIQFFSIVDVVVRRAKPTTETNAKPPATEEKQDSADDKNGSESTEKEPKAPESESESTKPQSDDQLENKPESKENESEKNSEPQFEEITLRVEVGAK